MEFVVSGWGRDHGEKTVARRDLTEAKFSSYGGYSRPEIYLTTTEAKEPSSFGIRSIEKGKVEIRFYAKIVLNGEYLVRQTLNRKEIARLFLSQYDDCPFEELLDVINEIRNIERKRDVPPIMFKAAKEIGIPDDTVDWLINNGISCVGDLVRKKEGEIRALPGFERHLSLIREKLTPIGLQLGIEIPSWPVHPLALDRRVEEFELSVRTANCLNGVSVIYVGELVQKSEAEWLRTPNFGRKSLNEIKDIVITRLGLRFGMEIPGWHPPNR